MQIATNVKGWLYYSVVSGTEPLAAAKQLAALAIAGGGREHKLAKIITWHLDYINVRHVGRWGFVHIPSVGDL